MAYNPEERYNNLEQRDKKLRELRKRHGVDTTQVMKGSCADMCPEKERYLREYGKQLSIFEVLAGSDSRADHDRMVKEYSRSSADQEEPLAHELRPSRVLRTAMNYLLSNIVNLLSSAVQRDGGSNGNGSKQTESFVAFRNSKVSIGEWYQFLWDRMRAIRKDITQQRLADRTTVELIEKCARFHIFCSARLCAESEHDFDAKLNQQNLENCLQTLKELYDDAYERRNRTDDSRADTAMRNEVEFRSYMLLMYVQDSATFNRHLLSLRTDLRDTPEIQRCVDVYRAYFANNFVRFFRLVAALPPLHAALLHRAFLTVRIAAASMLQRSFKSGGHLPTALPLSFVADLLQFDGEEDTAQFCRSCSLQVERGTSETAAAGEMQVLLDRSAPVEYREGPWNRMRAIRLIESKINVSIGELINGEPLANTVVAPARCSFDSFGRLIPRSASRQDSIRSEQSEQQSSSFNNGSLLQTGATENQNQAELEEGEVQQFDEDDWPEDQDAGDAGADRPELFEGEDYDEADYDQDGETEWPAETSDSKVKFEVGDDDELDNEPAKSNQLQFDPLEIADAINGLVGQLFNETVDDETRYVAQFELALAVREREKQAAALAELRDTMCAETYIAILNEVIKESVASVVMDTRAAAEAEAKAKVEADRDCVRQCMGSLVNELLSELTREQSQLLLSQCCRKQHLRRLGLQLKSAVDRSNVNHTWSLWKTKFAAAAQRRAMLENAEALELLTPTNGFVVTFEQLATEQLNAQNKQAEFLDNLRTDKFNYDKVFKNLLDGLTLQLNNSPNVVIRVGVAVEQPDWLVNKLRNVASQSCSSLPPQIASTLIGAFRSGSVDLEVHNVSGRELKDVAIPLLGVVRVRAMRTLCTVDAAERDDYQNCGKLFSRFVDAPRDQDATSVRRFYSDFLRQLVATVNDCASWIALTFSAKQVVLDGLFDAVHTYLNDRGQFDTEDFVTVLTSVMRSGSPVTERFEAYFSMLWKVTNLSTKFSNLEQFLVDLFTLDRSFILQLDLVQRDSLRNGLLDVAEQCFRMYGVVQSVAVLESQVELLDAFENQMASSRSLSNANEWKQFIVTCFELLLKHKVTVWLAIIENHVVDSDKAQQYRVFVQQLLRDRRLPPTHLKEQQESTNVRQKETEDARQSKRVKLDSSADAECKRELSQLRRRVEELRDAIRVEKSIVQRRFNT